MKKTVCISVLGMFLLFSLLATNVNATRKTYTDMLERRGYNIGGVNARDYTLYILNFVNVHWFQFDNFYRFLHALRLVNLTNEFDYYFNMTTSNVVYLDSWIYPGGYSEFYVFAVDYYYAGQELNANFYIYTLAIS